VSGNEDEVVERGRGSLGRRLLAIKGGSYQQEKQITNRYYQKQQ
jgi:hypothetical protein